MASNLLIACPLDLEAVMTRSISARTACCVLTAFFLAALAGCDGSGSARPDGSAGAGGSIVADGGGASGGTAGTGSGGVSATGGCSGPPVTFQVMPAPNGVTHWCLGQPTGAVPGGLISMIQLVLLSFGVIAECLAVRAHSRNVPPSIVKGLPSSLTRG